MSKYLTKPRTKLALLAAGMIAGGALFMSQAATAAQDDEGITVQSPRVIHAETVGRSALGAPIRQISLTRRVSFADLDLRHRADVNELQRRIRVTAERSCEQLGRLSPFDQLSSDSDCRTDAYNGGMEQVHMLISSR